MTDPRTPLAEYVTKGSESAFREVVERFINLVYGTALRRVDGDTHRAQDVVQTVFSDLARLAGTLPREAMLGGWLHRRTCHVAANLMRSEHRRQHREREAMNPPPDSPEAGFEQIAPLLDEAIDQLSAEDRAAITLRSFEGRDLRSVGDALGSNEDAAQKRVARALEKLRGWLVRQGVTASGAALGVVLSTQALTAAPAGLAASVSANKNHGQNPETWGQVADQIEVGGRDAFLRFAANNYEIVYQGRLMQDGSGETILFRERQPRRSPTGEWFKVYGFADSHTEIHSEPDGNFEAWEQQHITGPR